MSQVHSDEDAFRLVSILRAHEQAGNPIEVGVEIGVNRGATSARLLREFPNLFMYLIDPWATYSIGSEYRKSGDGCAKLTAEEQAANLHETVLVTMFAKLRRRIWRCTSAVASRKWLDYPFIAGRRLTFVFIDAQHQYEAVKQDIELWWPHVQPSGLLAGHDYSHPRNTRGFFGVDRAVNEFVEREGLSLEVSGSVWVVKKPTRVPDKNGDS